VAELLVSKNDLLLLCSDGLTRGVSCGEIQRTLANAGDLREKTDQLIALANDAGGDDNITVMLVNVEGETTARFWQRLTQRWFLKAS